MRISPTTGITGAGAGIADVKVANAAAARRIERNESIVYINECGVDVSGLGFGRERRKRRL